MAQSASRKLEDRLATLAAMERGAVAPDEATVRDALASKSGLLVAAAARLVASHELRALVGGLVPAFERLAERGVERDPGCRGKLAIAQALERLDCWEDAVFARGIRMVQLEPVWGGREDSAAGLRGECAMAFAHAGRADALDVLADLLADQERAARAAAAQAIGDSGRPDATALLRYKVRVGDPEPEVISACLSSMLALDPTGSLPFLAGLLDGEEDRATAAALALGESRMPAATPLLVAWCETLLQSARARVGYVALALSRDDAAIAYLLERVRAGEPADAVAAGRALATFRDDPRLAARLREAAGGREADVVAAIAASLDA